MGQVYFKEIAYRLLPIENWKMYMSTNMDGIDTFSYRWFGLVMVGDCSVECELDDTDSFIHALI